MTEPAFVWWEPPATPGRTAAEHRGTGFPAILPGMVASRVRNSSVVLLVRATHPRLLLATSLGMGIAAALAGRPTREVGLVVGAFAVGQAILGWHNDLVDRKRDLARFDESHPPQAKPVAAGMLDAGTVAFAMACGVLLLVPVSVSAGVTAGLSLLAYVAVGMLGNLVLRKGVLSWLPWAASYALLPAYLAYGGWGGEGSDTPPEVALTALAALLGVCVHVLSSLPGLVADNRDGWRTLPLRIALRTGAARLLWISLALTALTLVAIAVAGTRVGLTQ